jgi:ABC-2 type transport system permease protein
MSRIFGRGGDRRAAGARPVVLLIVRREILMRLRSRAFRVGTALIVALLVVGVVAASVIARRSLTTRVAFVGPVQNLAASFATASHDLGFEVTILTVTGEAQGEDEIKAGELDVLVSGSPTNPTAIVQDQLDPTLQALLDAIARQEALNDQLTAAGLDPSAVAAQVARAGVQVQTLEPPNPQRTQDIIVGLAVAYVLMYALTFYGSFVAQGVVEEKSTRIVEIVLATVRPSQLLSGKIIGIGLVGLLQLVIFAATGFILIQVTQVVAIPAVGLGAIAVDLVWFGLGFFLYGTAFAAGAALVSRQEDVANVTAPPVLFLIIAVLLPYAVAADPGSTGAAILSLLPPFAPTLMSFRMATTDVPAWQVLLAMALTLAAAMGMTWLAGRIYANSILHIGTRVKLGDALRGR